MQMLAGERGLGLGSGFRSWALCLPLACLVLPGCGESDSNSAEGAGGTSGSSAGGTSGGSAGGAGGTGGGAGAGGCEFTGNEPPEAVCVASVRGQVIDEAGQALPGHAVSVCGPACFYGETGSDGSFSVEVGFPLRITDYSATAHSRPLGASFYYPVSAGSAPPPLQLEAGSLRVLRFSGEAPLLVVKNDLMGSAPPAQSVTAQGVELEVEAGVQVEIEIDEVAAGEDGRRFRVRQLTQAELLEVAPDAGLFALYALGPFEARFSRPGPPKEPASARLSFPNSSGLPAGAEVEVLALGSYLFPTWVAPGRFAVVASARVSADGARIELEPGEGLPYLSWFGLRSKA